MNILAFLGQLGRALVSRGLGGPGETAAVQQPIPCPTVRVSAAGHTVARVDAAAHTVVGVDAQNHTTALVAADC
jgi:hypothetical protein